MSRLISPYEIVYKSALPSLRAIIAKRLQENYHMTQTEAAKLLGVTQASVSNYARRTRGMMVNLESDPTVARAADKIAEELSTAPDQRAALKSMTDVLDYIRFNHLMCTLHADLEPGFQVDGCAACDGSFSEKNFARLKVLIGN